MRRRHVSGQTPCGRHSRIHTHTLVKGSAKKVLCAFCMLHTERFRAKNGAVPESRPCNLSLSRSLVLCLPTWYHTTPYSMSPWLHCCCGRQRCCCCSTIHCCSTCCCALQIAASPVPHLLLPAFRRARHELLLMFKASIAAGDFRGTVVEQLLCG